MAPGHDPATRRTAPLEPGGDLRFSPRPNTAHLIAWRCWGDDAFAEALATRRPLLLAISAVWCHWCHVMDETTYSDPRVQAAIAAGFVPVRVDNDRRPDVNRRYNMGGWPTIAFLTPGGETLTGATYLSADQLLLVLGRVSEYYRQHEAELARPTAGPNTGGSAAAELPHGDEQPFVDPADAAAVVRATAGLYDPVHGGLGAAPKFPQVQALELLLVWGLRHRDERTLTMATHSLDVMAKGGLYDRVEDGFFRYATRRDWTAPHYEKMLEDNARLALLYLDTFAWTGRDAYADTAAGVLRYMTGVLHDDKRHVFWGSQDADEHYYGLDAAGRERLGYRPAVDRTAFVDWNALAVRALLRAATLLDRAELRDLALATLDQLWDAARSRAGMRHYLGGADSDVPSGLLADQAAMTAALLDAHETTGERAFLARATLLADAALAHLRDREGRFVDRPRVLSPMDGIGPRDRPLPVLDDGGAMADALVRLAALSGTPAYREGAATALAAFAPEAPSASALAAPWALAVLRLTERPTHVVVVGRLGDEQAGALLRAGLLVAEPLRSVQLLDPEADAETIVREGYAVPDAGSAIAFVCLAGVCQEPTADPIRVRELVSRASDE